MKKTILACIAILLLTVVFLGFAQALLMPKYMSASREGALIAEELAKEGYPAFIGPSFGAKTKIELRNKDFATVNALYEAGVPVSIITDAPVIPLEHLPMCAGFAIKAGLPYEEAWKAITINPAKATGIGDRVGSLEVGKDGDVVIWNGDPLTDIGTIAYTTIVNGKVAYAGEED